MAPILPLPQLVPTSPTFVLTDTSTGKIYTFTFCSCGALIPGAGQGLDVGKVHIHHDVTDTHILFAN